MIITSESDLRALLPNTVAAVAGERSVYDKLQPFLEDAEQFFERHLEPLTNIPDGEADTDQQARLAARSIVACLAFRNAAPMLDLVLTPNGFGVVSNDHIAPASRERVQALRDQLMNMVEAYMNTYVRIRQINCYAFPECLFAGFELEEALGIKENLLFEHKRNMPLFLRYEQELARRVIGPHMLTLLRSFRYNEPYDELEQLQTAAKRYIIASMQQRHPAERKQLQREMVEMMRAFQESATPQYYNDWLADGCGKYWQNNTFTNDRQKGGVWL